MKMRPILLAFLLLVAASASAGRTFYVSSSGDDARDGASLGTAFRTIQRGVKDLGPGDTLLVAPGVYREQVMIEVSGTREQPITIKSLRPHQARLEGSVRLTDWSPVPGRRAVYSAPLDKATCLVFEKDTNAELREVANLHLVETTAGSFLWDAAARRLFVHASDDAPASDHVVDACVLEYGLASLTTKNTWDHSPRRVGLVIEDFAVSGYNTCGIFIHNSDYCHVRRCIAHHCRRGIFFYSALRSSITGCESWGCQDAFNREMGDIGMMGYVFECLLAGNHIHHTAQHGIRFYGGFYGCTMRNNLAHDCNIGIHVKGQAHAVEDANRLARFSDGGSPNIPANLPMVFEGNVAFRCRGAGLLPHYCQYRRNTGVIVMSGHAACNEQNLELPPEETAAARFADLQYNDLRLQSDSPHRAKNPGAFPYRDDVFFVAPDGDDSRAGTSIAAAWRTLKRAMDTLRPGHTLYLLPAQYREPLLLQNLAGDRKTIIRAHGRGKVVLDGGGLRIQQCRNIEVDGLRIRNSAERGALIAASVGVTVQNCVLHDNGPVGIEATGRCDDLRLSGNILCFHRDAGARIADAPRAVLVNNIVRDNPVPWAFPNGTPRDAFVEYNHTGGDAPRFVNAAARDFTLARHSPCRGRGFLDRNLGPETRETAVEIQPRFESVEAVATSPATAEVRWRLRPGRGTQLIAYGASPGKLDQLWLRDTGHYFRGEHAVTLTSLKPGTTYFFRVGCRTLLDGEAPYHHFNYFWPARGVKGEAEYYATRRREDRFDETVRRFTTPSEDAPAEPKTLHVAMNGDDAADGSASRPLASLGRACELAAAGDRVVVHAGTYHDEIRPVRSGLPGQPITFEAAPGGRVILNGKNELLPAGADLTGRRHIVVRGFYFHAQAEHNPDAPGGQAQVTDATDVVVEDCVFDGRMNYVNSITGWRARDVTIRNNIFISHHSGILFADCRGTIRVERNTMMGPTINKVYAVRNERVVLRNNLFDENLFPKKIKQYRVVAVANTALEMDHNFYGVDPRNNERRLVDYGTPKVDLLTAEALPETSRDTQRFAIAGDLGVWQKKFGQELHGLVGDPGWANPKTIESLRARSRNWPNRFAVYPPASPRDFSLKPGSPCRGIGAGSSAAAAGVEGVALLHQGRWPADVIRAFHEVPWLDAASVRVRWAELEPRDQQFDWTAFDEVLAEVRRWNAAHPGAPRTLQIRVIGGAHCPRWFEQAGVRFYDTTHRAGKDRPAPLRIPVPYDNPEFLKQLREVYRAMFERYRDNPLVTVYHGTWSAGPWDEIFHPQDAAPLPPAYTPGKFVRGMIEQLDVLIEEFCLKGKVAELPYSGKYPPKDRINITGPLTARIVDRLGRRSPFIYIQSNGWGQTSTGKQTVSWGHERDIADARGQVHLALQALGTNAGGGWFPQGDWRPLIELAKQYDAAYIEIYPPDLMPLDTAHHIVEAFADFKQWLKMRASSPSPVHTVHGLR
jgi:hypothetical protein